MPAKIKDLDRMLSRKLGAQVEEGSKHTKYKIVHDGILISSTALSRSYTEVSNKLLSKIARSDLRVSRSQLQLLLDCPWSYEDYIQHVVGE